MLKITIEFVIDIGCKSVKSRDVEISEIIIE